MKKYLFPVVLAVVGFVTLAGAFLLYQESDAHESTGVVAQITAVSIGDDGVPVVTFTLADSQGNPLSLEELSSAPRFLIARLVVDEATGLTQYINYFVRAIEGAEYTFAGEVRQPVLADATQPTFESEEGVFSEISAGEYTYTFGQALGEDYDPATTHLVGAQIVREARVAVANPVYMFVPAGGEPTVTRLISTADTCNSCHRGIGAHGGNRNDFELCILCHTPQNVDPETGNTPDMTGITSIAGMTGQINLVECVLRMFQVPVAVCIHIAAHQRRDIHAMRTLGDTVAALVAIQAGF